MLLAVELFGKAHWLSRFQDILSQPTRFEQGSYLITQRWDNLVLETGIAAGFALACVAVLAALHKRLIPVKVVLLALLVLFIADTARVDSKFMFTIKVPEHVRATRTPVIEYLSTMPKEYRVLPLDGSDPMQYVSNKVPVVFTSNAVQQRRWQEFLDAFALNSGMSDIINLRFLVHDPAKYLAEKGSLGERFVPVYQSPDGRQMVLENRSVLPKAWMVPSVVVVSNAAQLLGMMQSPMFEPRRLALVESPPPMPLPAPGEASPIPVDAVQMMKYEGDQIRVRASNASPALLVLGEKYYRGWKATDNGNSLAIVPVNHVLRGVYLQPGNHDVSFSFDPWPYKVGKYLTFTSFAILLCFLGREWRRSAQEAAATE
jgi:hypothetical protein